MSDLANIINELPVELRELAKQYGPTIQKMTTSEILKLANYLVNGKTLDVYRAIVSHQDDEELLAEVDDLINDTYEVNESNAEAIVEQKAMATKVVLAVVSLGLSLIAKQLPF